MKYITLIVIMALLPSCAQINEQAGYKIFPENWASIKEWHPSHWKGQDFQATINPESAVMAQSVDVSQSMFAQQDEVSPTQFIENLKQADIIKRVYSPEFGFFWDRQVSDDVVVEVGSNFYTLSYADQTVVSDMISRAFQRRHYALQDWQTKKMVGQITPEGFVLF